MLGEELRRARQLAGTSQERLALAAHVHRTYISQLERDLKSPTLTVLFQICDALGISAADLVGRVDAKRQGIKGDTGAP